MEYLRRVASCAAQAQDLDVAEEAARRSEPMSALDPVARVNHALLRYSAGQGAAALVPLEDLSGPETVMSMAATIATRVHGEAEQWPEATAAAQRAPAAERYWLGQQLVADGALTTGIGLLRSTCPDLTSEDRVRCTQLLIQLGDLPD